MTDAPLEDLPFDELRQRAFHVAEHRLDLGFFVDVYSHMPGMVAIEGEGGDLSTADLPGGGNGESDPMYDQAVAIVLQHRRASISLVQRHLRIGYNRAARLLEDMEKAGMVSPMQSNGNREILVPHREAG